MTLEQLTYPGQSVVQLRLTECPCGHEFEAGDERSQHFLEDHSPEDFGLSSPSDFADGGDPDEL